MLSTGSERVAEAMGPEQAAEWLAGVRQVRSRARLETRGWWFPLIAFGIVVLSTAACYVPPAPAAAGGQANLDASLIMGILSTRAAVISVLWILGLGASYVASFLYYRHRGMRAGLVRMTWPWAVAGAVLMAIVVVTSPGVVNTLGLPTYLMLGTGFSDLFVRGLGPLLSVAVALPLLAWIERSAVLAAFSLAFLGLTLWVSLYDVENLLGPAGASMGTAANVSVAGATLLVAGLVAYRNQRGQRRRVAPRVKGRCPTP